MSNKTKQGVLVQAEVTFTVMVDTLVDPNIYKDEERLNDFLVEKAIEEMNSSDDEVEIVNEVDVTLTKETYDKYKFAMLSNEDWTEIIKEKRQFQN